MLTKDQIATLDFLAAKKSRSIGKRCFMCWAKGCEDHHVIHRNILGLRWYKPNRVFVCRTCHVLLHAEPERNEYFINKFIEVYGQDIMDGLKAKSQIIKPYLDFDQIKKEIEDWK